MRLAHQPIATRRGGRSEYRQAAGASYSLRVLFLGLVFRLASLNTGDHALWRVARHIPATATISATPLRAAAPALRKGWKNANYKADRSSY